MKFSLPGKDADARVFLEDTDRALPKKIDVRTRYAYWKTIAKGGKSLIQSCKDLHLSRTICHKSLRPELLDNAVEQHRFLREARVTAMLQHPSTVPVYELGRDPRGNLYFTMKLVHGYTLREIFNYRERYDLGQLMEVMVQVARSLDYAHTHGVVHRDIKPENILVGPFGEMLLLDWGLAKVWTREGKSKEPTGAGEGKTLVESDDLNITRQGKLEGTVMYMSPEQIRREPDIDHRTDIFSLGIVLFELLTGELPVKGSYVDEVLRKIQEDEPPKPSEVAKMKIPERLEEICLRCIQKDPADRVQNAADLVREFQEADWRV